MNVLQVLNVSTRCPCFAVLGRLNVCYAEFSLLLCADRDSAARVHEGIKGRAKDLKLNKNLTLVALNVKKHEIEEVERFK